MPVEKKTETITTKCAASLKDFVIAMAKLEGVDPSVYVHQLIEADKAVKQSMYQSLAEVFSDANGNMVSSVSEVPAEKRANFLRLVGGTAAA
ncbi:hypothetical protein [uncultured Amphritea sp.]|uniref:hypothetical protein n=1 Tax=uncultured Amphritea sp. TaxID=981605 RepID=UPI002607EE75|nr:hypothetical protein [uncultured Amphritea sp.]